MSVSESESRLYSFSRFLSGICAHLVCAVFTGLMVALARPGFSLFSWHPFLMTLGFSFLMTEAILLLSPHVSPAWRLKHQAKTRLHWALQCLCAMCVLLGLGAIFYNKHLNDKPHFSTWHGLIGLMTVCLFLIQSVGALPLLYHKLAKGWSLAKLKRYHAASGLLTYLMGSVSLLLGMCSIWFTSSVSGYPWYLMAFCPTLAALVVMNQVTNAYMAKKRLQY